MRAWLRQERAQLAIRSGDWAEALALARSGGHRCAPVRQWNARRCAALATGAALAETNPDRAERLARQALKADPSFTPAVVARAGLLRARGREKSAQAVLAEGWKRAPHPDIAALALAPADRQAGAGEGGATVDRGRCRTIRSRGCCWRAPRWMPAWWARRGGIWRRCSTPASISGGPG